MVSVAEGPCDRVQVHATQSAKTAVAMLWEQAVALRCPPRALVDPDRFRRERLYVPEVTALLAAHREPLQVGLSVSVSVDNAPASRDVAPSVRQQAVYVQSVQEGDHAADSLWSPCGRPISACPV
jgi:hypothetical protein